MPKPSNTPASSFAPGSRERQELKQMLLELRGKVLKLSLIIAGNPVKTGNLGDCALGINDKSGSMSSLLDGCHSER